ncbi:uncharacterized protein LOC131070238 isoform X2 [Cryptomeria japonica]|uniref:uncharacterized protein LOC131070238 isoform X2 n=1 Tax=Cryptomeria japonica TaxID=3369 RepID=UPI0027DA6D23|nr:uncharacterized protein LOC131070238 isoform X2 [Cryptomeria japonica]
MHIRSLLWIMRSHYRMPHHLLGVHLVDRLHLTVAVSIQILSLLLLYILLPRPSIQQLVRIHLLLLFIHQLIEPQYPILDFRGCSLPCLWSQTVRGIMLQWAPCMILTSAGLDEPYMLQEGITLGLMYGDLDAVTDLVVHQETQAQGAMFEDLHIVTDPVHHETQDAPLSHRLSSSSHRRTRILHAHGGDVRDSSQAHGSRHASG